MTAIAVDATHVYAAVMKLGRASIVRVAKVGGTPDVIVAKTGSVTGLIADGGSLVRAETAVETDDERSTTVVTADEIAKSGGIAEAVGARTDHPARLVSVPVGGGEAHELARLVAVPVGLAADNNDFYMLSIGVWPKGGNIDTSAGAVIAVPRAGGAPRVVVERLARPTDLELTAADVAWTSAGARWKVAKSGGPVTRLGPPPPRRAIPADASDGSSVYRAVHDPVADRTRIVAREP